MSAHISIEKTLGGDDMKKLIGALLAALCLLALLPTTADAVELPLTAAPRC